MTGSAHTHLENSNLQLSVQSFVLLPDTRPWNPTDCPLKEPRFEHGIPKRLEAFYTLRLDRRVGLTSHASIRCRLYGYTKGENSNLGSSNMWGNVCCWLVLVDTRMCFPWHSTLSSPGMVSPGGKCCQPALPCYPTPTLCSGKCNLPRSCRQATLNRSDVSLEKILFSGKSRGELRRASPP